VAICGNFLQELRVDCEICIEIDSVFAVVAISSSETIGVTVFYCEPQIYYVSIEDN
jgi:hypothetical protein